VNDNTRLWFRQQFPEWTEVNLRKRIDNIYAFFGSNLKKAKLRTIGVFGNKLGIECDKSMLSYLVTKLMEGILVYDMMKSNVQPSSQHILLIKPT